MFCDGFDMHCLPACHRNGRVALRALQRVALYDCAYLGVHQLVLIIAIGLFLFREECESLPALPPQGILPNRLFAVRCNNIWLRGCLEQPALSKVRSRWGLCVLCVIYVHVVYTICLAYSAIPFLGQMHRHILSMIWHVIQG